MTIPTPALASTPAARQQATGQALSRSAGQSLITCGSASLSGKTQRQSLGILWTRIADKTSAPSPLCETNGRHHPAGRPQPKPRPAETTVCGVVLSSDSHRVRCLGWLPSYRPGPVCCPSLGTIIVLQPLRLPPSNRPRASRDSVMACIPSACKRTQWEVKARGVMCVRDARFLFCFVYSFNRRADGLEAARALYHAYSLPALGPPPRLLAPGIETIEMRPCWPSSATSYPTGGSFSSSFSSALFS